MSYDFTFYNGSALGMKVADIDVEMASKYFSAYDFHSLIETDW